MSRFLLLVGILTTVYSSVTAQYTETFSTPNKGYLTNQVNDFGGVAWTLSPWITDEPETSIGRGNDDYFSTTGAGKLESIDLDAEVCWTSPLLTATVTGNISFTADLTWAGFDVNQAPPVLEYINVEYQINNGAWVRHPNVLGANGDPTYTVRYIAGSGGQTGATTTNFAAIAVTSGNTVRVRVCVSDNANAEIVTIDNINVTGVSFGCAAPILTTAVTPVGCLGPNTGAIDLSVTSGTAPYTYSWSNGPVTQDISGLATGTYTVTVTDAAMCSATASATVGTTPAIALSTPYILSSSCGGPDGEIDLGVSGGFGTYTYDWSNDGPETPDNDTQDLVGVAPGTYTVTVTDGTGCTATISGVVGTSPGPGPYSETFSVPNKGYLVNNINDFSAVNWTLSPWTYNEPETGTGRGNDDYFQTNGTGVLEAVDTDQEVCWISPELNISGGGTTQFTESLTWAGFDPEDYITVSYSLDGGAFVPVPNLVGGGAGTIQYTTSNNSNSGAIVTPVVGANKLQIKVCGYTNSQNETFTVDNVNVNGQVSLCFGPTIATVPTNVSCNGGTNGAIAVTGSAGTPPYHVSWSGPSSGNPAGTEIAVSGGTYNITGLAAGTYTVTVTDAALLTATAAVTITQPPVITDITNITNVACNGASTGAIDLTVSGGTPGYTYLWTNGQVTQDISGLSAGTYVVTITDANGCTKMVSALVAEPPALVLNTTQVNVLCNGAATGSVDLTVSGGTGSRTYLWSNGATTQDISGLSAATYNVTVTDANGCTKTTSATITQAPALVLNTTPVNVLCNGATTGSIDLTVSGGTGATTYLWSNGAATEDISGLAAGTYTVTVTDANNCTKTTSATITQPPVIALSTSVINVACNGQSNGAVDLTVTGGTSGYAYLWSNGAVTQDISGLAAGTYIVTVTDANNCTQTTSATVTQPAVLALSTTQVDVLCNGAATGSIDLTVTGGTTNYSYAWSNGTVTQDISGLAVGTYTVTVTDANGCTSSTSATITQPTAVMLSTTQVDVLCNGAATGSIDLTVSGGTPGYSYLWSNGAVTQDLSGLVAGTYIVTVTDANNCTKTTSATITQPSAVVLSTIQVNVLCNGEATGSVNLTVSGGTPGYTFNWSNGSANEDISGLIAGTYMVTVTDANNCTKTTSVTITQPALVVLTTTQVDISCNGGANGSIDLTVSGGLSPYNYIWSNGAQTQDISGLAAGTYTVTVTDENVCSKTTTVTLIQPTALVLNATSTPACAGVNNGTVDLTVSGGTPGYTYLWSTGAVTQDLTGLGAGTYLVTVTDANGCTKSTSATVQQSSLMTLSIATTNTCTGTSIGTINLTVTGGTPGFTYDWSNDGPETPDNDPQDLSGLAAGTYTVTVTDANTCTETTSATIIANPVPTVNAVANQTLCNGASTAAVTFSGTPAGVVFNWTNNAPSIGLAASGTGNIASFVATNTTTVPVVATITVTPSFTNGGATCPGTPITFTITVNPTPLAFAVTGGGVVCTTDNVGVAVGLSNSQTNVNYQLLLNGNTIGAPVAGTGSAITFGNQLSVGTYTVIATHTLGGCTTTMTGSVGVTSFNCNVTISDPCVCLNNATTLTNGQFGEQIKINAPSTQVWTVSAVTGLFQSASPAPPSAPNPITVGTVLVNIGGNMFTLDGRHVDAIGYTISITNSRGTTLSIGNTCAYPNPSITADLNGPFCLYSDPVTLTGDPGDANIVSQGFTVNGVPATVFDPGNGVGQYTIVYTVNGGAPKASGANDPGCIQSVSQIVTVVTTPAAVACNDQVQISLDEDCSTEILPDMVLEGSYLCFDDYKVELDRTTPLGNGPWTLPFVGVADINKTYAAKVTHLISGNSCWGLITIEDKLAPVAVCSTYNIACAETNYDPSYLSGILGITAAYPSVTENCGTYTQSYTDQWFDLPCPPAPTPNSVTAYIVRTWVVTDNSGNSSTCTQTINIIGSRVYDVSFPDDVIISCASNINTDPSATGAPYITFTYPAGDFNYVIWPASNHCELQAAYTDQVLPVCDGTYKILRTWTVYDWCVPTSPFPPTTNPQYYIQLIKIVDENGPDFVCPEDLTVSTDAYTCCATTNLPDVVMADGCSRINHVNARIYVYDQFTGELIITHDVPGTLTSFPGNNLWNPDTLANFGLTPCLPVGTHTVEITATDDCGNHATCSYELTVEDQTPPVVACDEWTKVALGNDGMAFVNATTFDDGSYDNCNPVFFKARRMNSNDCQSNNNFYDQVKFCCSDIGDTVLVVLRVYDVDPGTGNVGLESFEGHYNDCMVQAVVEDKLKPICSAPANVTVSCESFDPSYWAYGQATATDNCCVDTITHVAVLTNFDSLCNKGTITRRWTAIDCAGNSSQCTQRIIVQYEQDYYVKFPADRLVSTCDGTGNYGAPEFYGEDCELLATSFVDELFTVVPDACFKIERTWTVINWCTYNPNLGCIYVPNPNPSNTTNAAANLPGVTVSAPGTTILGWNPTVVKINANDPVATNYSVFWNANANCYQYKQIIKVFDTQDPTVVTPTPSEFCDYSTNDALFWNNSYWWDASIESHDLCEGDANIEVTATDACSGANISFRYLLFLDLDGNGTMETVVNSVNPPGFNNIQFNNANNPNYGGGESRTFDDRPVAGNQKWGWGLQTDAASGVNRAARVRWFNQLGQNTVPQLPYGTHKIKWFIEDGCGNEYVSEETFVVKDCKKPTVVCINGLSTNLMNIQGGMVQMWASDFLQYTEDNCTPSGLLKIGIRRSGTGSGFPVNADGTPQLGVTFTCADLGTQLVELWSIDKAGNADFCETYILIQDNAGVCGAQPASVAGAVKTETVEGIENTIVELDGESNGIPMYNQVFSNVNGNYAFSNAIPVASNATVTPTLELDPLNGVNTWDLVLISRHILGLEPMNSPYKLISADANKSGTVTTFDIVELRKLILGTYTELPNNSSWRFVDKTQVFSNNDNPFADVIRENLQFANIQSSISDGDFIGAKIGDIDQNADPNNLVSSDDRTTGTLLFDIEDRDVRAGETVAVTFSADQVVKGYQFTLNLRGLVAAGLENGTAMTDDNFGIFTDAVTTSWDAPELMTGKAQFTWRFKATKAGKLSEMLQVSSRITKAEAYALNGGEGRSEVGLRFNGKGGSTITGLGFELYQNTPNPWVNKTQIGFHLPEAAAATLTIYDASGRTLYTAQGDFAKGHNTFTVDRKLVETVGTLFYKVETAAGSDVKQMMQMK